ncbi:PQQ-binding-like beta-propeller repeat protein [Pirellulales bacterium]|nr:PQQ-binding-like beta-propeller repeat protein [Pirellulales bacterium]
MFLTSWRKRSGRQASTTLIAAVAAVAGVSARAEDWPTYGHDEARTSATSESLKLPLVEAWSWRSSVEPKPTWDEPGIWDGWHKVFNLRNRVDFDKAFHVAVVGNRAWFGSSVDDQIYCVDLRTGALQWKFFAEGPIRLAPIAADGKIFFGADDGYVYCLSQDDGQLQWKYRVAPDKTLVSGNGRLISRWPVRTSVAVIDGSCYACAGVFPSETVYVAAIDASAGTLQWRTEMNDLPAQGYLLASPARLYVFPGRGGPVIFDRSNGKRLKHIDAIGGTYALLVENTLVTTTGRDGRSLQAIEGDGGDRLAIFPGVHMIMDGPMSYLQSSTELTAIDRLAYIELTRALAALEQQHAGVKQRLDKLPKEAQAERGTLEQQLTRLDTKIAAAAGKIKNCWEWKTPCDSSAALILAGDTLISGGNGVVTGFNAANGKRTFEIRVDGNAYGLAAANGHLVISTDQGAVHAFASAPSENVPPTPQSEASGVAATYANQPLIYKPAENDAPTGHALGPFAQFTAPEQVEVAWRTRRPTFTRLAFGLKDAETAYLFEAETSSTEHVVQLPVGRDGPLYTYWVGGVADDGEPAWNGPHQFDGLQNYAPPPRPSPGNSPYPDDSALKLCRAAARQMIAEAATQRGHALVLGAVDGRLAYELACESDMKIVVIEPDPDRAALMRQRLAAAGVYGFRICVIEASVDELDMAPYLANLITSESLLLEGRIPGQFADVKAWLRPGGGLLWLAAGGDSSEALANEILPDWTGGERIADAKTKTWDAGSAWVHRREPLAGAGDWTHQYGLPNNAACSEDERIRGDMRVLWWGRPGARPMPDRGGRNPAPVSAAGRLFVQGDRTLFGLDAYNGTILWARQNPSMNRANVPRDGSNMVAAGDVLYVAMLDACVGFDGGTGELVFDLPVQKAAQQTADPNASWGYVAAAGDLLIGSVVARDAHYEGDEGEWYEEFEENAIGRVESKALFAVDPETGKPIWQYRQGAIMNSTIAIADQTIFFIESRRPDAATESSRQPLEATLSDQYLVALDLASGQIRWAKPYDFSQCQYMTYLCHSRGKIVVTGTDKNKVFHTTAFSDETGQLVWTDKAAWRKHHHSGHLAHPTIVGDRIYFNKLVYDLHSGKILQEDNFDWHGCGVMAASNYTIFSRFEFHGMLDLLTNKRTEFLGLRSSCWLNIIPSGGLLLAPEMSSGCSCAHSLQTSVAFIPQAEIDQDP